MKRPTCQLLMLSGLLGLAGALPTSPATNASFRYVFDDFHSGFDIGRMGTNRKWVWYQDPTGQFVGNDGVETTGPGGLTVISKGVHNVTGEPAFTASAPPDRPDSDNLEHVKYMALPNVYASSGLPGWDTAPGHTFSCEGRFGAELYGMDTGPFAHLAPWANYAAFGTASFVFGDWEKGWIFHLVLTNDRYWAAYERLAFTLDHPHASFTYLIPIAPRNASDVERVRVAYDRDRQEVAWSVAGKERLRLGNLGFYKDEYANHLPMDRGGKEEAAGDLNQIQCGLALISTMDAFLHDGPGKGKALVRMNQTPGYYVDPRTHSGNVTFLHEASTRENQIWGQGGKMVLRELVVANTKNK